MSNHLSLSSTSRIEAKQSCVHRSSLTAPEMAELPSPVSSIFAGCDIEVCRYQETEASKEAGFWFAMG